MRSLHLEKTGLRCLAIAESFWQHSKKSVLSGVVMRRDFLIDGFVFGSATLKGSDVTDTILTMFDDLGRPDLSYVLISGLILSMYNIVDIRKIYNHLKIPIIGISYNESAGIESSLKFHFPDSYEQKLSEYKILGKREKITLKSSGNLFVRTQGCSVNDAKIILDDLTLQGSCPEPLRVSQLLAKTLLQKGLTF